MIWFIEEEEIVTTNNEQYEVTETENVVTLTIKNTKPENAATYYAKIYNDAGSIDSNKVTLTVQCRPTN